MKETRSHRMASRNVLRGRSLQVSLAVWLVAITCPAQEITNIWRGTASRDWFDSGNWSEAAIPTAGQHVLVTNATGNQILLTNSTPFLASFTITNSTLTCSNWDTVISATNVSLLNNAILTLPGAFTNGAMSNRVYIVCTNLTLLAGATIQANGRGYMVANGPGKGSQSGSNYNGGGGHGGRGGDENGGPGGIEYDSTNAPTAPGSGGGRYTASAYPTALGAGGGVVRIAADSVLVNGTISAQGVTGDNYDGGGSGGAIWITCVSFAGTNGSIRADGGNGGASYGGGGGGGGRIALICESLAGTPSVRFSAAPGALFTYYAGGMGTLYLSSPSLLNDGRLGQLFHGVRILSPAWTSLAVDSLVVTSNSICLGEEGFVLTVTNDLVVQSNAWLTVGAKALSSYQTLPAAAGPSNPVVTVGRNVLIRGGAVTLGHTPASAAGQEARTIIAVGGDLVVSNAEPSLGGRLHIGAGVTNGTTSMTNGAVVTVGGDFVVASNAWYYPSSHPTNGGSVRLSASNIVVHAGGGIRADARGFFTHQGYGKGGGGDSNGGSGGGYGGRGGASSSAAGGLTYGETNRPIHPGSGGGGTYDSLAGNGGGLIWLEARSNVVVNGTITANGQNGGSYDGGGSGGGIFILGETFSGAASGVLTANGGDRGTGYAILGGGGGGRVAVAVALSAGNRDKLISGQSIDGLVSYQNHGAFAGTVSVTNGNGYVNTPDEIGSAVFLTVCNGTFILDVRGEPAWYDTPVPCYYGVTIGIPAGTVLTNTVSTPANSSNGIRRACYAWTLENDTGGVISNGSAAQMTFPVSTNLVLTYFWTNQYELTASAGPNGSVNTNAVNGWYTNGLVPPSIIATADPGYAFIEWIGDVPVGSETNNPLTVTMDQPRAMQAKFASITGETKLWSGTGSWTVATNWVSAGVPGSHDSVFITAGTVLLSQPQVVASVTVSNGAALTFTNWNTSLTATDGVIIRSGATLTLPPPSVYPSAMSNRVWIVCQDFTLESGATINADAKGYFTHTGPGSVSGGWSNHGSGGGHGGKGGASDSIAGGSTYGITNAPQAPGSGGGGSYDNVAGHGGGAVWIDASGSVVINGTITASGMNGATYNGGGAGGSIFIISRSFEGGPSAILRADGGARGTGYTVLGGGGGGRIAVWHGTRSEDDRAALLAGQTVKNTIVATNHVPYAGAVSVTAGSGYTNVSPATAGTVIFLRILPPAGTVVLLL